MYTRTHTHTHTSMHTHTHTHTHTDEQLALNGNTAANLYGSRPSLYGSRTLETLYGSHNGWYGSVRSNYMGMSASIFEPAKPEPAETGPSRNYI